MQVGGGDGGGRLVAVGARTGSLETSLKQASLYLDRESPRDLKKAFTIFEAVIIAVLGVMVCVAALSLLMKPPPSPVWVACALAPEIRRQRKTADGRADA